MASSIAKSSMYSAITSGRFAMTIIPLALREDGRTRPSDRGVIYLTGAAKIVLQRPLIRGPGPLTLRSSGRSRQLGCQLADLLDPELDLVAGLEEFAARGADARRRAGQDDVA